MKVKKQIKENLSLPTLQNLLKRDPVSYKRDFMQYFEEYNQRFKDFHFSSSKFDEELDRLIMFLAQVIHCYPEYLPTYTDTVVTALKEKAISMDPTMRMTFVKAAIMLKNKALIQGSAVIELFFRLFKCPDKLLRKTLRIFISNDIKKSNRTHTNNKLNTKLQNFFSLRVTDSNPVTAKEAVLIMTDLYRRNIWRDARTVNILANACFSKKTKVLVTALQFFLDTSKATLDDSDDESDSEQVKNRKIQQAKLSHRVGHKTRKRERKLERSLQNIKQKSHKKKGLNENIGNFSAIHLLHDPQNFAERLFKSVEHCRERFEVKLMLLDLISRVVGVHQLLLINFYPLLQRYLTPHQKNVTHLLLYAAQASHDQIPPDVMEAMCRTIADNFITERASSEAIAVGLNAVREIATRCPYAIGEDLLSDLIEYRSYRDKNVVAAARALIRLYRLINPSLLPKSERGRPTEAQDELDTNEGAGLLPTTSFGTLNAPSFIPGAEILPDEDPDVKDQQKSSNDEEGGWESCSEDSDDDDGGDWIDVVHSSDENEDEMSKLDKLTKADKAKKAELLSSTRIFSQEDFEKIRQYQTAKENRAARSNKRKGNSKEEVIDIPDDDDDEGRGGELVSLSSIERLVKRAKQDKSERLESVNEGREDREKYGFRVNRQNPHASTTNREKRKRKPFQMIKHKARAKAKKSFRQKQINLRDRLKKMAKFIRS